jgi:hypothetical protein
MGSTREIDRVNSEIISAYQTPPQEILPLTPKQSFGLHNVKDSLAPAELHLSSTSPRFLPNPGFFIVGLQNQTEAVYKQEIAFEKQEVEADLDELQKLNNEKAQALKAHIEKVSSASTWQAIKNVASYFAFATSTAIGLSAAAPHIATVLIGSGAAGLINRVLADTGVWKKIASYFVKAEETQETVSRCIDTSVSLASAGVGLFTFAGGAYAGAVLGNGAGQIIREAGYYGSTLISAVANSESASTKSSVYSSDAEISKIEGRQIAHSNDIKIKSDHIQQTAKESYNILSKAYQIVQNLIEELQKLTGR